MKANNANDLSDGEVSDPESNHSNSSRDDGGRESSEDVGDSSDSSEMDESECEGKRSRLSQHVQDLESQFTHLREQLYQERLAQVEHQLVEVKAGRSPDYLNPLEELQKNMSIRIEVAGILRQYKIQNVKNQFEAEEQAAEQNFESEKGLAYDFFFSELMDTIRSLEEDRHNCELSWGEGGEWCSRPRSRSRKKAVTVSGPYIVYMLKPQDIMEDWTLIRKAIKRTA
ncbi:breast cancer metastasis-suppressor 1-like protein [Coccinella septempunctata]|uniref:breast cancer metastasis-suppressor 1-like protein n=1 Tax=Coccinella septempunctata TaxID=41139 RepID=UPI001D07B96E|nr:breast cancer metastasis-suppressor 1-like protein [Coccinella septempunctata]